MDPNHRDRVAFMRVCSGHFKRGMKLKQSGSGKDDQRAQSDPLLRASRARRSTRPGPATSSAFPITACLRVGDTLTEGEDLTFTGIPNFAPEIMRRVRLADPMKAKHLQRALEALAEEGVTQVFRRQDRRAMVRRRRRPVAARRAGEPHRRRIRARGRRSSRRCYETARWVASDDPAELKHFLDAHQGQLADDRDGAPVFMAKSAWELRYTAERKPKIKFTATHERRH